MKPKGEKLLRQIDVPTRIRVIALGMFHGMRNWRVRPEETPQKDSIQANESYYALGYAFGTLTQGIMIVLAAHAGGEAGLV